MSKALEVSKIDQFRTALTAGIDGIVKASQIYVSALDEDPANADKFRDQLSELVPASAWAQFEAVGRKWMHPRLLLGGVSDKRKASIIKRLPYSYQERIFNHERFKLLTVKGDTLSVDPMECTSEQAEQLFSDSGYRSLGEQRAFIESLQKAKKEEVLEAEILPYTIVDNRITFRRGCVMNRTELKRILQEM